MRTDGPDSPTAPEAASRRLPILHELRESGVVAVLRADAPDRLEDAASALVGAGVLCLELTMTTPGALEWLSRLQRGLPNEAVLGMGSVTTAEEARQAIDAGARFIVSPGVCPDVVAATIEAGVGAYPGAWTPSEVLSAWASGASAVKLFPAAIGGPAHLRQLAGPLPDIPLIPTGGVGIDAIAQYVAAGAVAVGLGGPLLGDALSGGSRTELEQRARAALAAVREGRRG